MDNPLHIAPGFFALLLLALGLVIGSFLNVVIVRVPLEQSVVHPRSRCPRCGHMLPWYENIPVLSWLFLLGRCSGCKAPIPVRYPLVELITGMLFLACLRRFGWTYELIPALLMVSLLIPLTFIDLEHWLLPFALTVPGIVLGVLSAAPMGLGRLRDAAIGAGAGFVAFWVMERVGEMLFKKEALGEGDKYLLAMLGGFLTYKSLLAVVFLSSLQGAVVGSLLLLVRGRAGPAPKEEPASAEEPPPAVGEHPGWEGEGAPAERPATATATPEVTSSAGDGPAPADQVARGEPPQVEQAVVDEGEEEDDWVPGPTSIPFGPWLALAALEVLLLGDWIASLLPRHFQWLFDWA